MSQVSYFQRYSQRENHVTNNTLLVLRHLYQTAPSKLQQVIGDLLGQELIGIGPTFRQQTRGAASIPDGMISQAPFRLYIETKLGPALDAAQLDRHIDTIAAAQGVERGLPGETFLFGLATEAMDPGLKRDVAKRAAARGVIFTAVSFAELVDRLTEACAPHEVSLKAIIDDFIDFLEVEGLLFQADDWMLVAPCGTSMVENAKFGVYYHEADKPKRSACAFFGAYSDKAVRYVGRIQAVVVCSFENGELRQQRPERGETSSEVLGRIKGIIRACPYYDLTPPHRYWVMDELAATNLVKRDKGPVRGSQYLRISSLLPPGVSAKGASGRELAALLDGRVFPPIGPDK